MVHEDKYEAEKQKRMGNEDMTMQKRAGDDCSFGCPLSVTEMQPADRWEFHQEKACYLRSGTEGRVVTVNEMDPCSWIPAVSQAACSAGGCSCAPLKPQCLPCHCCDHVSVQIPFAHESGPRVIALSI